MCNPNKETKYFITYTRSFDICGEDGKTSKCYEDYDFVTTDNLEGWWNKKLTSDDRYEFFLKSVTVL